MLNPEIDNFDTAALYLHIPFCEKRCVYCDFYTVAGRNDAIPRYLDALAREIALRAAQSPWRGLRFGTVFFGGGTPSLLTPQQVAAVLAALGAHFQLLPDAEITLETNPGTTNAGALAGYFEAGINRLSLGVQSFWPDELQQLDRLHSVADIENTVAAARAAGIANLSLDLIFALPGQRPSRWRHNLARAIAMQPEHISAYNLTIEKGTPLFKLLKAGKVKPLSEWQERVLYRYTIETLERAGFEHYEISNYARPGYHSRHNSKYWDGSRYLGLGASAHSFDGRQRFWNVDNYVHYCQALEAGRLPQEQGEVLTPEQARFEMIFLGLRRRHGVDRSIYQRTFGRDFVADYGRLLQHLQQHDPPLIDIGEQRVTLTLEGQLLCDSVCAAFLPG